MAAGLYLLFLLLLSFVLLYGASRDDPNEYTSSADELRLVCEILVIMIILFYIADEINEALK